MLEPDGKWQLYGSGICFQHMPSPKAGDFLIQYSLEGSQPAIQDKTINSLQGLSFVEWAGGMSQRTSNLLNE